MAQDSFDAVWCLQANADVRASGMDPWDHYRRLGWAEGRAGVPVQALELDHLLWRRYEAKTLPELERLLAEGPPRERGVAGWYLEQGRSDAAWAAIQAFHATPDGRQALRHPGPYLLAVQLALASGEPAAAKWLIGEGLARFGPLPDFDQAANQLARARYADDWKITAHLARLFIHQGQQPVGIAETTSGARFDRLCPPGPPPVEVAGALPLVSVIVPVFNGAAELGHALRGLREQSWQNLEILVVDDGSTDDSRTIAEAQAAEGGRIWVIAFGRNEGAYPARNAGMEAARGAFVTVHDADDWSHPQKIEMQMRPLLAEPGLRASVSHRVRAGDDLEMTRWRMEDRRVYRNVSSLMIRAALRDEIGYWGRVTVNADTEYYYRIIAAYGPQSIREICPGVPLAFSRTAPGSLTNRSATHLRTQFRGVRWDYMEAAHYWHAQAGELGDFHLPQHPDRRPFRVLPKIGLGDPEPEPSDFDIVSASPLFDADWYRQSFPEVLRADISPARHYLTGGARENRDPGSLFSSGGYQQAQGLDGDTVPLLHYERQGRSAGAAPAPGFAGTLTGQEENGPVRLVFAHTSGKTLFGAERSLLGVVGRMAQRGDRPVVHNTAYLEALLVISAAVEIVPQIWRHMLRPPLPATVGVMRDLIRKYRPAEVHVNMIVLDAPLAAARQEGVLSVVHVRELLAEDVGLCRSLGGSAEALWAALLKEADRFVATSAPVVDCLARLKRTVIRPNSVDPALFDLPFTPGRALNLAMVSSNTAKKGLSDFLAVARLAEAMGRPLQFRLIGPLTPDLQLMRPWPETVEFCGYAETPAEAMAQADVIVSLSKFAESFRRTVVEAMAAGRSVICDDRGAPPTLVESDVSGFVVCPPTTGRARPMRSWRWRLRGQLLRMSDAAAAPGPGASGAGLRHSALSCEPSL